MILQGVDDVDARDDSLVRQGGLGDLMVSAAMDDWTDVDDIRIGIALDSWHPTHGTRITDERNTELRCVGAHVRKENGTATAVDFLEARLLPA